MKLNMAALRRVPDGELIEIRGAGASDKHTTSWAVRVGAPAGSDLPGITIGASGYGLVIRGVILGADFSQAVDMRLDEQQKAIERLLLHVKVHCPEMNGRMGRCGFMAAERERVHGEHGEDYK